MTHPRHTPLPPSPRDNLNIIAALVLSALVMFGWRYFFPQPVPKPAAVSVAHAPATSEVSAAIPQATTKDASSAATYDTLPASREEALRTMERVRINTPALHGSINLRGLRFDDVTLAGYHETVDDQSPEVVLFTPRIQGDGYFAEFGWSGSGVTLPDASTLWSASADVLTTTTPITFHWTNPQGLRFEQHVAVDEHYMFTITRRVVNATQQHVELASYGLLNRTINTPEQSMFVLHTGPVGVSGDLFNRYDYDELREGKIIDTQENGWAGITDKYWQGAILPQPSGKPFSTTYQHYVTGTDQRYQVDVLSAPVRIAAGETQEETIRLFAGAKVVELLDHYRDTYHIPMFDRSVDFGTLYFLTRPMFEALDWLHGLLGSFGLAILALTVCIKLLMYPLANKSYGAMSQMKLLMPKITELRERYGDDRLKMNQETMALYKREGVNPASGCLPMLIQIPVFFSLYKVLFITLEMRHAPFYGWIEDLSAPDPTNLFTAFGLIPWDAPGFLHVGLWPLIMTATMVIQQRLNPKPADPTQAQVMAVLPYLFLFLFASFPAGLVIYWAWNNTLSIIQQYIIIRRYEKLYDKETGKRIAREKKKR